MIKCYWLLNHLPTDSQQKEISDRFHAEIVFPPDDLSEGWGNVPLVDRLPDSFFSPFEEWFSSMNKGDIAVIQGEMSATFRLVSSLCNKGVSVYCSVAERVASETREGNTVIRKYVFQHALFREYR